MKTVRWSMLIVMLTLAMSMSAQLVFQGIPPCRVADTRNPLGPLGGPSLLGGGQRDFPILQSACGIPGNAAAYSFNLTVVPHGPLGYLTLWPTGLSQPLVSTLNSLQGFIVANAAIVPSGSGGQVSVFVTNDTDLIIDIDGYFAVSQTVNHGRTTATIPDNAVHEITINWASAFPDTNYTVTCISQTDTPGTIPLIYAFNVSAVNKSSISLDYAADFYPGGFYPFDVTIHCIGVHD